jgi:hypothetical protein
MPQAIAALIVPFLAGPGLVGAIGFTGVAYASLAIGYGVTLGAAYLLQRALMPKVQAPTVPKPEDGRYNIKQAVPSPWICLGRSHGGGHYLTLLEYNGVAYHVICMAVHRIKGYQKFRLHDQDATLDGGGVVTSPTHFEGKVKILSRRGLDAETAYAPMVSVFGGSSVWTNDHRGDGLATFMMSAESSTAENYQKTYPHQMPQPAATLEGHDRIYDPRTATYGYTENLALFRLWHLTSPYGGKLKLSDMHLPDWIVAANVCDQAVTNRTGGSEPRYHGGFRFPANADPVAVGFTIDQAAELVVYERADGLVGVHAGQMTTPTVTVNTRDIKSIIFQPNRKKASSVLAVRGQWTNPAEEYVTTDAAIYGDPYIDDGTDHTKTVANPAVQRHNHIQRLQKLAYIRARAQRVAVVCDYRTCKAVVRSRFVTVNHPPKMVNARVEIIGRPKVSLASMTVAFEGMIVPTTLYDFNAATEEGIPGASVVPAPVTTIPVPTGFDVTISQEAVSGGALAAFGVGTWTASPAFVYEMQWEPSAGGTKQSAYTDAGAATVRSSYLADGVEYRFRLRAWGGLSSGEWTSYVTRTATADPTPPGIVTGVSRTGGAGQVTINWTAPNSANYVGAKIYRNTTNSFGTATLVVTEYGAPSAADSYINSGLAAGTYYFWVVAVNGSGVGATEQPTGSVTVT